jgi:NADPH:quinone reductase-like Zn-dependent oxidoreductase
LYGVYAGRRGREADIVKAAVLRQLGGPPEYGDFDEPVAGEGQVVVDVAAAAVHHVELAMASGRFYLGPPRLPTVLGIDGVGRLANGRRVFVDTAVPPFGTWAQRALAVEANLLDVADGVEDAPAAALGNSGLTAWLALAWRAPVQPGEGVLVLGAAGAVGWVAVQAARVLGAGRVIAAVLEGQPAPPGADAVVTLTPGEDWAAAFREATGGAGADVIIDPLWGPPALAALRAAAMGARFVQIGNMAGEMLELAAPVIRAYKVDILGHAVFHASIDVRRAAYLRLTEHAARGDIAVRMEAVPLPDVAAAWMRQGAGADAKLVLLP